MGTKSIFCLGLAAGLLVLVLFGGLMTYFIVAAVKVKLEPLMLPMHVFMNSAEYSTPGDLFRYNSPDPVGEVLTAEELDQRRNILYNTYKFVKKVGVLAIQFLVDRTLLVPDGPGDAALRLVIDTSAKGQFREALRHFGVSEQYNWPPGERFVLDLGTNDGFQGSHSFNLIHLGWSACLVEPHPDSMAQARVAHGNIIDGGSTALVSFIEAGVTGNTSGTLSLCVRGPRKTYNSFVGGECDTGMGETPTIVPVHPVAEILKQCEARRAEAGLPKIGKKFGLVSIDIEGLELEVLAAFLRLGYRPRIIILELFAESGHNRINDYLQLLQPHGYSLLRRFGNLDAMFVNDHP